MEKTNDDLREKNNNLMIQKDLLQNEFQSLKSSYENEKNSGVCLVNRINELEATVQLLNAENSRLKDRESWSLSEMAKLEQMLSQLRKEKSSLELELKNIELNLSENDQQQFHQQQHDLESGQQQTKAGSDLVNGNISDISNFIPSLI